MKECTDKERRFLDLMKAIEGLNKSISVESAKEKLEKVLEGVEGK